MRFLDLERVAGDVGGEGDGLAEGGFGFGELVFVGIELAKVEEGVGAVGIEFRGVLEVALGFLLSGSVVLLGEQMAEGGVGWRVVGRERNLFSELGFRVGQLGISGGGEISGGDGVVDAGELVVLGDGLLELGDGVVLKVGATVGLAEVQEASISEKILVAALPSPRSRSATASS
jgi:hypothetical protein